MNSSALDWQKIQNVNLKDTHAHTRTLSKTTTPFFCASHLFAILSLNTVCTRTLYAASQTIHIVNLRRALGL